MSDKPVTIGFKTTADTTGAKATVAALDKVEAGTKKAAKATDEGGKGMGKAGMLANQASFQIGDFATQVEMGTSAMRAFSQQAPQLIGAFQMAGVLSGPVTMALAGVAVALPIITMGVKAMGSAFGDAEEAAKKSADAIAKFGKRDNEELEKQLAGRMDALDRQAAKEEALAQRRPKTLAAQIEYSDAILENARKFEEIQAKLAGTLGIKLDRMREIEAIEDRAEARLVKKAQEDLAAQEELLAQAREKESALNQRLAAMDAESEQVRGQLAKALAERKALYDQKRALEGAVKSDPGFLESLAPANNYSKMLGFDGSGAKRRSDATSARAQLAEGGAWDNSKGVIDKRIEILTASVGKLDRAVEALGTDAFKAGNDVADQADAVAIQSEKITATLDGAVKVLQGDEVLAKGQAFAESLAESVGTIQANNARVATAKDAVAAAAKDGVLSLKELQDLGPQLVALTGGLQVGTATTTANVQKLIAIMQGYQAEALRQKSQIQSLGLVRK